MDHLLRHPAPGETAFSDRPEWLHWLDSCPSTNTWAIAHAERLPHGAVVFTRDQTAGRGQYGRIWHSPIGVITASFVLDFPAPPPSGLSLVVGLAVIYAIEDLLPECQGKFWLKWCNDVLFEGRKVAGILCEATSGSHSGQTRAVVGIGLNRSVDFAEANLTADQFGRAISLHQISDVIPDELAVLTRLRHYLLQLRDVLAQNPTSSALGIVSLLPELQRRDYLRDRSIKLELNGETMDGQAMGIDHQGCLLVKLTNGQVQRFVSGRVVWWDESTIFTIS